MNLTHNPLTKWIREFIKHQPEASTATAWQYISQFAPAHQVFPWLLGFDADSQELIYRPAPGGDDRRISRASFRRQYNRARQLAGFVP